MKHAFLILAHGNYPLLSRILKKADHRDNTVFIHIDAKSDLTAQDMDMLKKSCIYSDVHFIDRYKGTWGGYSLVHIELRLLEAALPMKFDYYHFMSGADFFIKPMAVFHRFFEEHCGYEFVDFGTEKYVRNNYHRVAQYHFFRDICGRNRKNPLYWLNWAAVKFQQKVLHTDRLKKYPDIQLKAGSQWCSLTHDFAEYLLGKEDFIRKFFAFSHCSDELFVQTVLYASPFADRIYKSNMRSVDWIRAGDFYGSPHIYTVEDYDLLVNSYKLICRKVTDQTPEGEALIQKLETIGD